MRAIVVVLVAASWCVVAHGQTASPKFRFDAASLNVPPPSGGPDSGPVIVGIIGGPGTGTPKLVRAYNASLQKFILTAFDLQEDGEISGPSWLLNTKFDMSARVPEGTTTQEQVRLMLQDLLSDRFGLRFHYETRTTPGFNLVVAKSGSKLKTTATNTEDANGLSSSAVLPGTVDKNGFPAINPVGYQKRSLRGANHARWVHETMDQFSRELSLELRHIVVDRTDLKGEYHFEMYWVHDCPNRPDCQTGIETPGVPTSPSLAAALEQQLGLKLIPVPNVPTRILVVDHIERAPTPN